MRQLREFPYSSRANPLNTCDVPAGKKPKASDWLERMGPAGYDTHIRKGN